MTIDLLSDGDLKNGVDAFQCRFPKVVCLVFFGNIQVCYMGLVCVYFMDMFFCFWQKSLPGFFVCITAVFLTISEMFLKVDGSTQLFQKFRCQVEFVCIILDHIRVFDENRIWLMVQFSSSKELFRYLVPMLAKIIAMFLHAKKGIFSFPKLVFAYSVLDRVPESKII